MARDYELAEHDFWQMAETALRVGYDKAELVFENYEGRKTPWLAKVRRAKPMPPERTQRDDYDVDYIEVWGHAKDEVLAELTRRVRAHVFHAAFYSLLRSLPHEERSRLEEYAKLLLEADHTVILASKGKKIDEIADDIKSREYSEQVDYHVQEIVEAVRDGEIEDDDGVYERIREIGVIYTGSAQDILRHAKNDTAYWDEMGGEAPEWTTLAAFALQADVRDDLPFNPSDIHKVDCPRCGSVVSTEDESDETDCPKCGIDLSTEIREGYFDPGPPGAIPEEESRVCQDCADEQDGATRRVRAVRIPPEQEFDCVACDGHFLTDTPKAREGTHVIRRGEDTFRCATCGHQAEANPDVIPGAPITPNTRFTCFDCGDTFITPSTEI